MKTCLMYVEFGDGEMPWFFLLDGDYSNLDGVVIGASDATEEQEDELSRILPLKEQGTRVPPKEYDVFVSTGFIL